MRNILLAVQKAALNIAQNEIQPCKSCIQHIGNQLEAILRFFKGELDQHSKDKFENNKITNF